MLAPQFKHSLHKSWCGRVYASLLFWADGLSATPLYRVSSNKEYRFIMDIKSRIERSPQKYFFASIITSFCSGLLAFQFILSITNNTIIQKDSYIYKQELNDNYIGKKDYNNLKQQLYKYQKQESAIILEPTWVELWKPIKFYHDQILLEVRSKPPKGGSQNFKFIITFPSKNAMPVNANKGIPYEFAYKNEKFSITLLDDIWHAENDIVNFEKVLISINKIL